MSEENMEVVRRLYDATVRTDREGFIGLHDPDVELIPLILNVEGRTYCGHEGVGRFWDEIHDAFPDWHWEADEVRDLGTGALVKVRICGHGTGSGVTIDERAWHVLRIKEGRVVWWRIFANPVEAREAAGLSESA